MSNIGVLPEKWRFSKLKFALNQIKDGTHGTFARTIEGRPFLSAKNVYSNEIVISENESMISEEDYKEITKNGFPKKGDLLLTIVGTIGRVNLYELDEPLAFQRSVAFLRLSKNYNSRYYFYYLQSDHYLEELMTYAKTSAQSGVYMGDVSNTHIVIPPLELQGLIADYLDDKVSKINGLIKDKEQLIQLLNEKRQSMITEAVTKGLNQNVKMKDSGVEWIGKIPEHWEVKRIKNVAEIHSSNVDKKSVEGETEIRLCNYVDVYYNDEITKELNFMKATAKPEQIEKFTLRYNDVIITKDSESPNDIAIPTWVAEGLDGILCGYHLALIRAKAEILNGHYLYYLLESESIREQFYSKANGVTRFGLPKEAVKNGTIPLSPVKEQQDIASYLYAVNQEVKGMVLKLKDQIEKIKEYRQSLIYEAVTGKIDVRDFEVEA
ncbi:hypothetical protein COM79_27430 [Bacillus cereus]|uniref:restriction endonuclease subunit S n=1 Tax=Bacillus cereus group TaxID=86661 RepID=UPI000BEB7ED1|nr:MULTISPECIES: restriction endonuclease subunit S [Bacillus cereus group]PEB53570.1 hypothetical protein COM79_27430 [Bacillus cereus]PEB85696.1 hypothetical protein COM94_18630 [Bacillus thuringiensis]PGL03582.1 hypothetical protein CN911_00045 [Bacillus thuringiensis]